MLWLGVIGHVAAALGYAATALVVIASNPRSARAALLVAAIIATSVWSSGFALAFSRGPLPPALMASLDAGHLFAWTLCVVSWLPSPAVRLWILIASAAAGAVAVAAAWPGSFLSGGSFSSYPALVLMALFGLLAVEQVYRNAHEDAQRHLKPLCLAAGGIVAVDLFVYSHAALLGAPQPFFWAARGIVNAALLPLILLGARKSGWEREPFVSRQVVFYTASLFGVGTYLLAMGLVAYAIRAFGREWSFPLDLAFLAVGVGALVLMLLSSRIRARLKVSLVKHFYRSKYDYRSEWLRLTQSLSRTGDLLESAASGLEGLARIIGSQRGDLWVEGEGQRYEWRVSMGDSKVGETCYPAGHPLVSFLSSTGWVIDTDQYARDPDRYGMAFGPPDEATLPPASLIVPLERQGGLQGFAVLSKPPGLPSLNFEDHDILKTAGRQVAAVLGQAIAQEKLAETRQFEALNQLSAFLMHDLKNIVAQQELVVGNAQRFRHREDFIDDAFSTIRSGTERIKKVLEQLTAASRPKPAPGRVDVSKVIMEVRSQCADRQPIPQIDTWAQAAFVRMNRDELASVLHHLVRNAQEATPADGRIDICLAKNGEHVAITVSDTGCGMDPVFVRDRLFRPFDSTKGPAGMGIGAYQARHIVRSAGGELDVESSLGCGTAFKLRLPAAE